MGSDCRVGPDIQVYDDGVGISVLTVALPSHDTDVSRATFCQTDLVALGTLSLDKGRILRKELSRLTNENCGLKEKLTSKEITLESLTDHEHSVRYFTGLTDFMTLVALSNPFSSEARPLPFQALVFTLMHKSVITPLLHISVHDMSRDPQPLCFP